MKKELMKIVDKENNPLFTMELDEYGRSIYKFNFINGELIIL